MIKNSSFESDSLKKEILAITTLHDLMQKKSALFGKNGTISEALKNLRTLTDIERKKQGKILNEIKEDILFLLQQQKNRIEEEEWKRTLAYVDITLPGDPLYAMGYAHPLMHTMEVCENIFSQQGFVLEHGPDIEESFYNFDALNVHENHPARAEHDTFYLSQAGEKSYLLRTQTSPVQIRTMLVKKPPLRMICLGRVYRADHDRTHTPMFHQIEGLCVEKDANLSTLKSTFIHFFNTFFEKEVRVRFRPSYFPFTTPSLEVDIAFEVDGAGGWMEVAGAGMVHPQVFINCSIDPDKYKGFAFGMGIERITMIKHGITDIRDFYQNDQRWLRHFGQRFECQ